MISEEKLSEWRRTDRPLAFGNPVCQEIIETLEALYKVVRVAEAFEECRDIMCYPEEEGKPCPHKYDLEQALAPFRQEQEQKK